MSAALTVEGLSVDRAGRAVLRGLSFHLAPGAALMVTGSNGAGKSTLLRALAGLIPRVAGAVRLSSGEPSRSGSEAAPGTPSPVHGRRRPDEAGSDEGKHGGRVSPHPSWLRHDTPDQVRGRLFSRGAGEGGAPSLDLPEHTSYLGHGNGLKPSLTARENLSFTADWTGRAGPSPELALDAVGLAHLADFPVRILSAGQRRRVALAALLVAHRPLWLLDEPATALDAAAEALLTGLMRAHLAGGGLIVAAIHAPLDVPARQLRLGAA